MSRRDHDRSEQPAADENFLQRWSRLKSTTVEADKSRRAGEADAGDRAVPAARNAPGSADGPDASAEAPALPDLDQLDQDSDYSAFLAPQVDAALRRAALRKLFHSPKFNVCDGLDDYCDDFTQFAPLSASVVTADMRHQLERAASKLVEQPGEPSGDAPTVAGTEVASETPREKEPMQTEGTKEDDDHRPA
jgi:hypothetical protein